MASLRERLARELLKPEIEKLGKMQQKMVDAYIQGPYVRSPEALMEELKEYDSAIIQDVMDSLQWDLLGAVTDGYGSTDLERTRAIDESKRLWRRDVITSWIIQTWTNFGFGENIVVTPTDPLAQDEVNETTGELIEEGVWTEFWEADRNAPVLADDILHHLSDTVLIDGEIFLVYYISTIDGKVTIRTFDTKSISEIVTADGDSSVPLFYKRIWQDKKGAHEMYYPDALAYISGELDKNKGILPKGAKRADKEKSKTIVLVQHIAHNKKTDLRGWPLMTAGAAWTRAHKRFREDRASVASLVAMTVNKLKVKGGSRATSAMKTKMEQMPTYDNTLSTEWVPNAPGTFVQNPSADLERMPLNTSAGDAKQDGEALLLMAGLGGGLFPHWLGAGDAYRLATATAMETPLLREFDRYQRFWASHFRRMVRVVLWGNQEYGIERNQYKTFTAQVSTDRLVETDVPQLATSMGVMVQQALIPTAAVMPAEVTKHILQAIWRQLLQAMGVEDAVDITSDAVFKIGVPEAPQPLGYNAGVAAQAGAAGGPVAPIPGSEGTERPKRSAPVPGGPPTAPPQPSGGMRIVETHGGLLAMVPIQEVDKFKPEGKRGHTASSTITDADVEDAVKDWDAKIGGEYTGLLAAKEGEEK